MKFIMKIVLPILLLSVILNGRSPSTESEEDNKLKVGYDSFELLNLKLDEVTNKLQDVGFSNIQPTKNLVCCDQDQDGLVTKIIINGTSSFEKNDKYSPSDEVVIQYNEAIKIKAPDVWSNLIEKHYEEVEKLFKESGFTNIKCIAHEIDYDESKVFEGSIVNICIGENNSTFELNEEFYPSDVVRIDYRIKPNTQEQQKQDINEEIEINPFTKVDEYNVYFECEYEHIETDNNTIRLGNNERLWITINATPSSLTSDDFILDYDNNMLEVIDISEDNTDNKISITYELKKKKEGFSDITIFSYYDFYEDYEYFDEYILTVNSLNAYDGTVVYVAPTGEKYHYSSTCIENPIKTTLYDALLYEYTPCCKCVN